MQRKYFMRLNISGDYKNSNDDKNDDYDDDDDDHAMAASAECVGSIMFKVFAASADNRRAHADDDHQ